MIHFFHLGDIMQTPEIVLLGLSSSGKTHFAGQLYGRLRRTKGNLLLRQDGGTPPDLSPLDNVLNSLASGHAAEHTQVQTWAEIALPIVDNEGRCFDLRWPDYGGEQLTNAFLQRAISEAWRERLRRASGWIVLIRLKTETTYPEVLTRLREGPHEDSVNTARVSKWDANARWVEMLQIFLHVAGHGVVDQLKVPKIAVMLSCYDELGVASKTPAEVLAERLPLVSSFIKSNWSSNKASVWGLSALGGALDKDSCNEHFIDEGPETLGWVVDPSGSRSSDLTLPLAWILKEMDR
ncbi:hypothetical protein PS720_05265 [Pseudomonas fluorescens]|nr:hypothetical protein PS720_05265 [Pseudomonas fluorescens]